MSGRMERLVLQGRQCVCFVPEDSIQRIFFLCGWKMEPMLPALAEEVPETLLFFAEADGGVDFTPWPAEPARDGEIFSGGGTEYLRFLTEAAAPYLHARYDVEENPARRAIFGYSLGGLFALWALCGTDFFGQGGSLSGSLWYPGFVEYLREQPPQKARWIYLSLGDREPFGGPPPMRTVGQRTEEAAALLRGAGYDVTLEWNRGGHAKGVENRWKKALRWAAYGRNTEERK